MIETPWSEGDQWLPGMVEGPHHMGTTRMADDAASGVVDRNCRVHGLNGLYIAGSSIFPTGGHANPTMSILAFALRLALHVSQQLGREVPGKQTCEIEKQQQPAEGRHAVATARIAAVTQPVDPDTQSMLPAGTN